MYIFLDESGDLGFDLSKPGTSRFFNITLLVCDDRKVQDGFKKAVERTRKNKLNQKARKHPERELKGTNTELSVKRYFHRQLPQQGWAIYSVTLNKVRVDLHLQTAKGKHRLYNFLARFLLEKVKFGDELCEVSLVVDRCKNGAQIQDFNQYMASNLESLLPLKCRLNIDHLGSHESAGLQAVDLFCWGMVRRVDAGDEDWFRTFERQVRFHTIYLPS